MKDISPLVERLGYLFFLPAVILCLTAGKIPAAAAAAVFAAYIIYNEIRLWFARRKKKKLARAVVSMLDMTSQKRLEEFPVPVVVASKEGDVLWYNEAFTSAAGETALIALHNVTQLDPDILNNRVTELSFDGRYYSANMDCYKFDERELFIFYLFDITAYRELQTEYRLSRPAVAYLVVDNYDEVFTGMKESDRTSGMAAVDEIVNAWATASGGILCHSERERYLFVFEQRALQDFVKNRFDVMDQVREIPTGSRLAPTLSIGVGTDADGFMKNEEAARAALDMALSRGGDQTVIKSAEGFEFFGARSRNGERRTRIKTRIIANALNEHLKSVRTLLIMGHSYGDLDCLGAAVGMARIAKERAITARIVVDETTDLTGNMLRDLREDKDHRDWFVDREEAEYYLGPDTAIVVVDTFNPNRTVAPELLKKCDKVIVIDHHRKGVDSIQNPLLSYLEPYASSACEMVTELFHYMDVFTFPEIEANALLAGIFLDTKNFTIRTNTCTFDASSTLRKAGANTVAVKQYFQTDMGTYRDKTRLVSRTEIYRKAFAIACWDGEPHGNLRIAAAQAADEMLNIENVRASFTLFTDKAGNTNISGRSYGAVNVQLILEKFENGGGHLTMAGAFVKDAPAEEVKEQLLRFIDSYLEESNPEL